MFCLNFSTINKGIGVFVTFTVSSNHIWKPTESAEMGLGLCQLVCREYNCRLCRFWTHKGPTSWESWESSAWAGVRAPGSTITGKGGECSVHIMKTFCVFFTWGKSEFPMLKSPLKDPMTENNASMGYFPHVVGYLHFSQVTAESSQVLPCDSWGHLKARL